MSDLSELRVLELYSGIGGMHYALKASHAKSKVVAAIDINPHAKMVYEHNFKETLVLQKTIEGMKIDEFNKLNFDMLLMSPPCQPFTRQGKQAGSCDNRSQSFLSILQILQQLKKKPRYILMENVKGFDDSTARDEFLETLDSLNYNYQEYLLSPIQFGIPNSRLRYFLIAKLEPFSFEMTEKRKINQNVPEIAKTWIDELFNELKKSADNNFISSNEEQASNYDILKVKVKKSQLNNDYTRCSQSESMHMIAEKFHHLNEFIIEPNLHQIDKDLCIGTDFAKCMSTADLVSSSSTRTSCFTKNYGRYNEGTGSILITSEDLITVYGDEIEVPCDAVRYLSPREVSNLHCFPQNFEFPKELTSIQKWRLIGNSLNVLIVAVLIKMLIN